MGALEITPEELIVEDRDEEYFGYHRSILTSPSIHATELRRIFGRCWLYLGHESEVPEPGDFRRRTVANRPLFFVRSRASGEINVFANSCTHRGATICRQETGNAKTFQCFYHAWTFDTDGGLVGLPDEASYGGSWDRSKFGLKRVVRAESYRGFIFVNFDPDAVALVDYLAGAREYIDDLIDASSEAAAVFSEAAGSDEVASGSALQVLKGSHQYGIKANWKLLVENSMDGYHLHPTHQTYFQFLKDQGAQLTPSSGTMTALGNGHIVIEYAGSWGRPVAKWSPQFGEESKAQLDAIRDRLTERLGDRGYRMAELNRNLFIYPNTFLMDNNALAIRTIQPTAPAYMDAAQYELAPAGESPGVRAVRLESYVTFAGPGGLATPDDVEALESCQQGTAAGVEWSLLSRGYHDETPSLTGEEQIRVFYRRWFRDLFERDLAPGRR